MGDIYYEWITGKKEERMTREEREKAISRIKYLQKYADDNEYWWLRDFIETFNMAIEALEQEPCDDVCEWFEQYVDIATDIVVFRFSDGTVKRAKRGLYMRDIEKSIRKMLIDQMADEKKQEPKWIPVSDKVPADSKEVLMYIEEYYRDCEGFMRKKKVMSIGWKGEIGWYRGCERVTCIAWMPLPQPYKGESEDKE